MHVWLVGGVHVVDDGARCVRGPSLTSPSPSFVFEATTRAAMNRRWMLWRVGRSAGP